MIPVFLDSQGFTASVFPGVILASKMLELYIIIKRVCLCAQTLNIKSLYF